MTFLNAESRGQQTQIIAALGREELLSQCSEECCELAQAAQKVRRAIHGTTPVTLSDALDKLNEEAGDVLLLLDYLERMGLRDLSAALESAKQKNTRWYGRTIG